MMRSRSVAARRRAAVLLGAGLLACPVVSRAATFTWNGGDPTFGLLTPADNWVSNSSPYNVASGTADLLFASTNPHGYSPTLSGNLDAHSLTFNTSALAYSIVTNGSGFSGILTLESAGMTDNATNAETISGSTAVALNASQPWNVSSGTFTDSTPVTFNSSVLTLNTTSAAATANFSGTLNGSTTGGFTKTGLGTLNLTGSGSALASLALQGGTTQVSSGSLNVVSATNGVSLSGGAVLNLSGGAVVKSSAPNLNDLIIGGNSSMLITGSGSQFNGSGFQVSVGNSTPGSLTVASSGSLALSNALTIGNGAVGGTGTLTVNSGGTVIAPQTVLSFFPGVTGSGSTLTATTSLDLGGYTGATYGTGILTVTNGGKVNAAVTQMDSSTSSINISGGTLTTGGLAGTSSGTGAISLTSDPTGGFALNLTGNSTTYTYYGTIVGSGTLDKTGLATQNLAANNTFTGQVIVGVGALVENGLTDMESPGVLNISGGTFSANAGISGSGGSIKLTDPALGTALTIFDVGMIGVSTLANISGTGSVQKNGLGYEGLLGANTFTGQVLVNAGVLELATGTASAYNAVGGTLILDSSVSNANGSTGLGGILTGVGNFANVTINAGGTFAPGPNDTGVSQNGSGGVITITSPSTVSTNAKLTLNAPTTVSLVGSNDKLTLGGTINGSSSLTTTGPGTLILSGLGGGSTLTSLSIQAGATQISSGSLQLTAGSAPLLVQGGATLTISNAATVTTPNSTTSIVDGPLGTSLTVTGSGSALNASNLTVGNTSYGSLTVTSSATLSLNPNLIIGSANGSNGTFALTGGSSATANDGFVAKSTGSSGSATVDGSGSVWTITGPGGLTIGGSSASTPGSVSITNSGSVSVNTAVTFSGPNSSMIVNGGTLTAGSLKSTGAGFGSISLTDPAGGYAITLNSGSLGTFNYSGSVTGTGSLNKTGSSTQILSGSNMFTGLVYVQAGTLEMASGAMAYAEVYSGATLQLDYGNYGSSSLVADPGGTLLYNTAVISGGTLLGGGTHNVSSVKLFSGTTITNGVTIMPANQAQLIGVNNSGIIIDPPNSVLLVSGSNVGGTVNVSGTTVVTSWTSSGILRVNAGGVLDAGNSNMLLLGGSQTYVGSSAAPGGQIALIGGVTIELNGGLLVNYGSIAGGKVDVNYAGLATGTGNYSGGVVVNPGGTYLPGNYGTGSPPPSLGSPFAMIQPATSGATSTSTPVTVATGSMITVNPGDTLTLAGGLNASGQAVTKLGGGALIVAPFSATDLNVSSGVVQLSPSSAVLEISSLAVGTSSKLDLASDSADISGGTLSAITALAKQGFANGAWNGAGSIISSTAAADTKHLTAIGVIQNNQSGAALFTASHLFEGTTPGISDILSRYTYYGDSNLDGKVDGTDYSRIDNGLLTNATGWYNGDFNYDGAVNGSDYTLIDNAFNTQGTQLNAIISDPAAVATHQIAATATVPEPGVVGLLGIASIGTLKRRRSRHSL